MNREITYSLEQRRLFDISNQDHDTLIGLAFTGQDILGQTAAMLADTEAVVSGLAATQTATASLTINIAAGRIYQQAEADATAQGGIAIDTTIILQQGFYAGGQVALSASGIAAGQSRWSLIEAQWQPADVIRTGDPNGGVLPFLNTANPLQPLNGQGGSGATLPTERQGSLVLQVVTGSAATTGSEVPPTPTGGWVPLYLVDLTYGQTQVTNTEILTAGPSVGTNVPSNYPQAPFLAGLLNSHHSGGAGQAPQVNLATEVQGVLPIASGGTGAGTPQTALAALGAPNAYQQNILVTSYAVTSANFGWLMRATLTGTTFTVPSTLGSGTATAPFVSFKGFSDGTTVVTITGGATFGGGVYEGRTSVTLGPNQIITASIATAGNLQIVDDVGAPGRLLNIQRFTASGTYTPTAGAVTAIVKGVSGGGAGGGTPVPGAGNAAAGSGGVGGTYAEIQLPVSAISGLTVTPGAGGAGAANAAGGDGAATTVGTVIAIPGGVGGATGAALSGTAFGIPTAPSSAAATSTAGTVLISQPGYPPGLGVATSGGSIVGGSTGGSSRFGPGAVYPIGGGNSNGAPAAANSGGGGSGAGAMASAATTLAGGNGGSGYVEIWEYS